MNRERDALVTANPRRFPSVTFGQGADANIICVWPAITDARAGAPPLKGNMDEIEPERQPELLAS
jgi:hypothetical protein